MLFKRKSKVQELIQEQIRLTTQGLQFLKEAVAFYLEGNKEGCELKTKAVEEIETKADGAKREAEKTLYEGMYLPLFREDLLDLMELIDDVADEAEKVVDFLCIENPEIPSRWNEKMKEIIEKGILAFNLFRESFMLLYEDTHKAFTHTHKVRDVEKEIDRLQDALNRKVFQSDLELAHKIQLRDLIIRMGYISDVSENAADKIGMISIKRRV